MTAMGKEGGGRRRGSSWTVAHVSLGCVALGPDRPAWHIGGPGVEIDGGRTTCTAVARGANFRPRKESTQCGFNLG
jgi:hypothetical protein